MTAPPPTPPLPPFRRRLHAAAGLLFVGLGFAGALLPVLPTTPFLLLALWAFARSSPRLEAWLLDHPRFGPRLRAFRAERVVPWPVKITAWVTMAISYTALLFSRAPWPGLVVTAALMLWGVAYVARCPSYPTRPATPPDDAPP